MSTAIEPRPLTPAQRRVLTAIQQHLEANGAAPTYDELGAALGCCKPVIHDHIKALAGKGYLERTPHATRSLVVLHPVPTPLRQRARALCDAVEAGVTGDALAGLVRGVRDAIGSEVVK